MGQTDVTCAATPSTNWPENMFPKCSLFRQRRKSLRPDWARWQIPTKEGKENWFIYIKRAIKMDKQAARQRKTAWQRVVLSQRYHVSGFPSGSVYTCQLIKNVASHSRSSQIWIKLFLISCKSFDFSTVWNKTAEQTPGRGCCHEPGEGICALWHHQRLILRTVRLGTHSLKQK